MTGEPRTLLISGTSRGLGQKLRDYYLEQGDTVIGCSRSMIDFTHPCYSHFIVDVSDEKTVNGWIYKIRQSHTTIHALINNAGTAAMNHTLLMPGESMQRILATNVLGPMMLTREVAKVMSLKNKGRIVNLSSVARPLQIEGEAVYAASKAALESFTKIVARELAPYHITVNALGLTPYPTDLIAGVPPEKIDAVLAQQALPRMATLKDVTHAIDFFLDERSDFISGQLLYLGGIA